MGTFARCFALFFSFALFAASARAESAVVQVQIRAARGADAGVDYGKLAEHGPWDDRNYALTAADVALLPASDSKIHDPIPAFYRVQIRRAQPALRGDIDHYPRSAFNGFRQMYIGYQVEGRIYQGVRHVGNGRYEILDSEEDEAREDGQDVRFLLGERRITSPVGHAESAIAINPVNTNLVIAGSNAPTPHQIMWRSTDGGATWLGPINLPDAGTCCDPTVGWSSDGTVAYTATLDVCSASGCSVKFYRSTDNGASWTRTATLTSSGSDKEFIHVDTYATSPHKDKVYIAWHDSNVQKFARSTDGGQTFGTPLALDNGASPNDFLGIGSDLTSDKNGNVFFVFPSSNKRVIRVLKSTDGGQSFLPGVTVSSTFAGFDFPLPSMETRNAFIYTAVDTDLTSGPFANSVYASWTDTTATDDDNNAANNHARIQVGYSRDGGATWSVVTPHPTSDAATVDRYNQWLKVDNSGRVHVVYYNTKNSSGRTGVDLYYTYSVDGGVTWQPEQRVTTQTSPNIADGFEWGDYNGMDMVLNDVIAIFTDNRDEAGGSAESIDVYSAGGFAPPAGPSYTLTVAPASQSVCAGTSLADTTVSVRSFLGFNNPVTLSLPGLNATVFGGQVFSTNPVTPADPAATSTLSLGTLGTAAAGNYVVTVHGTGGSGPIDRDAQVNVQVSNGVPATPTLSTPADTASGIATSPTLTWAAVPGATSYLVQVATDAGFSNIVASGTPTTTSFTPAAPLAANTLHYWRVRAINICGNAAFSTVRQFTTANEICFSGSLAIPDNLVAGVNSDLTGTAGILGDLNVRVKLNHTYVGDLILSLTHVGPATAVSLINRPGATSGACGGNDMDTTLDDEAAATVQTQCAGTAPTISGTFKPNAPLSGFDGQDFSGTWRLNVSDRAGQDTGALTQWCLLPSFTTVTQADAALILNGPATYTPGAAISYTITVTNTGPTNATALGISDAIPASIAVGSVNCAVTGTGSCGTNASAGNTVQFNGAALNLGAGNSLVVTVNGTVGAGATGNIVNTATVAVGGTQTDPATPNNTATTTATSTAPPPTDIFKDSFE